MKKIEKIVTEVRMLKPAKSEPMQDNVILIYSYQTYVGGGSNCDSMQDKYIKEAKKILGWKRCFNNQLRPERIEDEQYLKENNISRIIDLRSK